MKRPLLALALCTAATIAAAQDRGAELERAVEETKAAAQALKAAEERRDQGVEALPGERIGTASGGSRASDDYSERQAQLERDVEEARRRHDEALKRWNDLK